MKSINRSEFRASVQPVSLSAFIRGLRTGSMAWLHMIKTTTAALVALGVAMRLDLPQAHTAMATIFVLLLPESGMVLAKSFYRICGTIVGLIVMVALIGLFPQQPELFVAFTSVWVGICTAGASCNRNFRSYGFVLAGYTAAVIGFPASQNPDGAFLAATGRFAEVIIGILCSASVSALIFPRQSGDELQARVRARFTAFADHVKETLALTTNRSEFTAANTRFVTDIVGFEAARSVAIFEGPEMRNRRRRLGRLNSEFMQMSTRFHTMNQLMDRLRASHADETVQALVPYLDNILPLLSKMDEPVLRAADAGSAASRLDSYMSTLPARIGMTRSYIEHKIGSSLLDFDTATELFTRLIVDLHAYVVTYASLVADRHEREEWSGHFYRKTNKVATGVIGLRAAIVIVILGAFWIATAWPSGPTLTLNAAAVCALASSLPRPVKGVIQMTVGAAFAIVSAMIVNFEIFPVIDGFPLLCVVLAPWLLVGTWLMVKPNLAGYGVGYCIYFCILAGPDNVVVYNPSGFMNDSIAIIVSMIVVSVVFAVFFPPATSWLRNRLLSDMRRLVLVAALDRLGVRGQPLRIRFESCARDLMFQINAQFEDDRDFKIESLEWFFSTLEIGTALIDLRAELVGLSRSTNELWTQEVDEVRKAIAGLFNKPTPAGHAKAVQVTCTAIEVLQNLLSTLAASELTSRVNVQEGPPGRVLCHLHFIRTALLDPQSPVGKLYARRFPVDGMPVGQRRAHT